jgi:hypothetical protein
MFNTPRTIVLSGLLGLLSSVHGSSADPPTQFADRCWDVAPPSPTGKRPDRLEFTQSGEGVDLVHGPFTVAQTNRGDFSDWPPVAVIHDARLTFSLLDGSGISCEIEETVQSLDVSNRPIRKEEKLVHGIIPRGNGRFERAQGAVRGVFGRSLSACSGGGSIRGVSHVDGDAG